MKDEFLRLIGEIPQDPKNEFRHRFRVHQGWWRTAVLLEEPGPHPIRKEQRICSTINVSERNRGENYLSRAAVEVVKAEIAARQTGEISGIIQEPRIWNNLLSSQPLCFNFWGPLKFNHQLANVFLSEFIPDFSELVDIRFEWAPRPKADYTGDNSAFDVMIEYLDSGAERAILDLECKYTDSLASKEYSTETYKRIYEASRDVFVRDYDFYVQSSFNQLFRNHLIACAYERKDGVRSHCGVFCSADDTIALDIAKRFQAALASEDTRFLILTYEVFIGTMQKLALDWETRKWTMLLWARYLGLDLSKAAYQVYRER